MKYRDYIFSNIEKKNKLWYLILWKWIKLLLYLFLLISMLWGCSQMTISKYNVWNINDVINKSVHKPGVFFEILIGKHQLYGKEHYFHIYNNKIYEYPYLAISTWSESFTKTKSPFYGFFVFPIAFIMVNLIVLFGGINNGAGIIFSIFITSLFVRLITLVFSWKSQKNQEKMQSLQIKQSEIQYKYKNSNDPNSKQKQQMEIMSLYKKEGLSPLSAIGSSFLSFPFLIAMYTVIKTTRELKIATIGQISLIEKPWDMIKNNYYIYLVLIFVYLPIQILSMILPTILNYKKNKKNYFSKDQKKAKKKQLITQGIMIIVFFIVTINIASGVAIYWIFSAFIQILQILFFHYLKFSKRKNKRVKKIINKK